MARPLPADSAVFYHNYIRHAKGDTVKELVANHSGELEKFYTGLPDAKENHAYAEGKWTVKELLLHLIDAERVFVYRALRFARRDATPLSGFDENSYAENSYASSRSFQSLKEEFTALRHSTDIMVASLNDEQLKQAGVSSNNHITVNALVYIIYGHLLHHKSILEERYL